MQMYMIPSAVGWPPSGSKSVTSAFSTHKMVRKKKLKSRYLAGKQRETGDEEREGRANDSSKVGERGAAQCTASAFCWPAAAGLLLVDHSSTITAARQQQVMSQSEVGDGDTERTYPEE
jgi:hypothetical protein